MIRVHRIPYSTNVERVALAAGIKAIEVEWADHDPADRAEILALSGQPLVPVAEVEGEVIADSMRIVERLERLRPHPPLWPRDATTRALADVFCEWFNAVWKGPPNELDDERAQATPDEERIAALAAQARSLTPRFEALLADWPFLLGPEPGIADVCAFPFLKYAVLDPAPGDDEPFHAILAECLRPVEPYPRLAEWVARVDALARTASSASAIPVASATTSSGSASRPGTKLWCHSSETA